MQEHKINLQRSLHKEGCKDNQKAVSILINLYLIDSRKRFPNFPEYARYKPKYSDKTANGLTRMIIDFIRFSGGQAERINCTGRLIDKRQTFTDSIGRLKTIGNQEYIKTTGQKGTADISATIKGRSVKIEVKAGSDRQSEYQKQYQKSIEASGGIYFIAKDFDQFFSWYNQTFQDHGKTEL